jgi:hypothetical protein
VQRPAELKAVNDVLNYVGAPQKCRPKLESPTAPVRAFSLQDRLKSRTHAAKMIGIWDAAPGPLVGPSTSPQHDLSSPPYEQKITISSCWL